MTVSLAERLASLNEGDIFLDTDIIRAHVLPQIAASTLAVASIYIVALRVAGNDAKQRKICYQITNFCANLTLSMAGVYFECWRQTKDPTPEQATQGHEEFLFMSTFQIGYQLWAIPVGLFQVNESPAMLAHHVTVVAVGSMSAFFRNGFRYWTPFFYGIIEISSIPLSIMNFFKDNPKLIEKYPSVYSGLRAVFSLSFLLVRLVMFVPRHVTYLTHHYLLQSTHPLVPYRIFMGVTWLSSLFLLLLQLYWSTLIVKGIVKQLSRKGSRKSKSS